VDLFRTCNKPHYLLFVPSSSKKVGRGAASPDLTFWAGVAVELLGGP
jgi:hypothetical protein